MCDFSSFESNLYKGYASMDAATGIYVDELENYYYEDDYIDYYVYYDSDEYHSIDSYVLLGYAFLVDDYDVSDCHYIKLMGYTTIYMPIADFKKYMLKYLEFIHTFKKKYRGNFGNDFLYWMDALYTKAYSLKMIDECDYKGRLLFHEYKDLYEGVFNEVAYLFHLIGEYLVTNDLVLLS